HHVLMKKTTTTATFTLSLHDALPIYNQLVSPNALPNAKIGHNLTPSAGRRMHSFDLDGLKVIDRANAGTCEKPRRDPGVSKHIRDRKSTRLNSSHVEISYAVFCLKKK